MIFCVSPIAQVKTIPDMLNLCLGWWERRTSEGEEMVLETTFFIETSLNELFLKAAASDNCGYTYLTTLGGLMSWSSHHTNVSLLGAVVCRM